MNDHFNLPALPPNIFDILDEYDAKVAALDAEIEAFNTAVTKIEVSTCLSGTYAGTIWERYGTPKVHVSTAKEMLCKSAWRHVYSKYKIAQIASASDRKAFEMSFENPPEFTEDNVFATFEKYLVDPRHHILKGLAECFVNLDPAYKSHSNIKIGVQGLPKRIILSNVGSWGSWGYERLKDTLNALRVFQGRKHLEHYEFEDFLKLANIDLDTIREFTPGPNERYTSGTIVRHAGKIYIADGGVYSPTEFEPKRWRLVNERSEPGLSLKRFGNGNAHLHFDKALLREINLALSEFYGDVLPDTPEENPEKKPGTELAKDLQFYATPRRVIDDIIKREVDLQDDQKVLDPSCGEGAILEACRDVNPRLNLFGIECHGGRAQTTRDKGFRVFAKNFLETQPVPEFDWVIMNPPFYGRHWRKHLDHARKFLKAPNPEKRWERGRLICILPATAYYDGHLDDVLRSKRGSHNDGWRDLPVASFAESGTNVPTGYITLEAE